MIRALDKWLVPYLRRPRRAPVEITDVMIAVCDHFEPFHHASPGEEMERLARWEGEFPEVTAGYTDSDGLAPAHTFFYPIEQYNEPVLSAVERICKAHHTEVEIHLHHSGDTEETLREKLRQGIEDFSRHGFLPIDAEGNTRYSFIHGNWALDHSHPTMDRCGVPTELTVLRETGCYADYTFPSAPDPTQPPMVNAIYYAEDTPEPCSHHRGRLVSEGTSSLRDARDHLLLINGPLGFNWGNRKAGVIPKIENGEVSGTNPANANRLKVWLELGVHVQNRPEWVFVKLHTHGGTPQNMKTLLGQPMKSFYEHLAQQFPAKGPRRLHYVTAREMANIVHAAEGGKEGDAGQFRDHLYTLR